MMKTRFAPSPTGLLHKGHAFAAKQAFGFAEAQNGECLLRIEDIDQTRCKPAYEEAIIEDLRWLGFSWPLPVRRQSEHFADYQAVLNRLIEMGLAYKCFKTRKEVLAEISRAPHTEHIEEVGTPYFGTLLNQDEEEQLIADGKAFCWRLNMRTAQEHLCDAWGALSFEEIGTSPDGQTGTIKATPEIFGDVIIARKDAGTSYHIAAVSDDALQEITHIVRGQDLYYSTHLHCLLQKLLGYQTPIYKHHRLITNEHGKKFSKRDQSVTIKSLRESGADAITVLSPHS